MSSKFSIRPAPRKAPWLCKASPAPLPVPAFPPSLYATLYLAYDAPPYPPALFNQTLLLTPVNPGGPFRTTWNQGSDFLNLRFNWSLPDEEASASADWSIAGFLGLGAFPTQEIQQWPKLSYTAFDFANPTPPYRCRLRVTN